MSSIKPPQHDLYERIGKVTVDGRTKAYKEAVSRLQNAAEIRQQRKDAASLSQGHSDGHSTEMDRALGAEYDPELDEEHLDEIVGAVAKGLRALAPAAKKVVPKVKGAASRVAGKVGPSASAAATKAKGAASAAGTRVAGAAKTAAKRGHTAVAPTAKKVTKSVRDVATKHDVAGKAAKVGGGARKALKSGGRDAVVGAGAAAGSYAGGKAAEAGHKKAEKKLKKTESIELAIEEAIEERVLEILSARGIVDESVAALKGIRRGGRIIKRGVATARSGKKLPTDAARTARQVKGGNEIMRGAKTMKTAAGHANKATKVGAGVAGTYAAAAGLSQTKTAKKLDAAGAANKKKSESIELDMGESPEIEEKVMSRVMELLKNKGIDEGRIAVIKKAGQGVKKGLGLIKKGTKQNYQSGKHMQGVARALKTGGSGPKSGSLKAIKNTITGPANVNRGGKIVRKNVKLGAKAAAKPAAVAGATVGGAVAVKKASDKRKIGKTEELELEGKMALVRKAGGALAAAGGAAEVVSLGMEKKKAGGTTTNKKKTESVGKLLKVIAKNPKTTAAGVAGVAIGRKSKESKVKVQKGTTQWQDEENVSELSPSTYKNVIKARKAAQAGLQKTADATARAATAQQAALPKSPSSLQTKSNIAYAAKSRIHGLAKKHQKHGKNIDRAGRLLAKNAPK